MHVLNLASSQQDMCYSFNRLHAWHPSPGQSA